MGSLLPSLFGHLIFIQSFNRIKGLRGKGENEKTRKREDGKGAYGGLEEGIV